MIQAYRQFQPHLGSHPSCLHPYRPLSLCAEPHLPSKLVPGQGAGRGGGRQASSLFYSPESVPFARVSLCQNSPPSPWRIFPQMFLTLDSGRALVARTEVDAQALQRETNRQPQITGPVSRPPKIDHSLIGSVITELSEARRVLLPLGPPVGGRSGNLLFCLSPALSKPSWAPASAARAAQAPVHDGVPRAGSAEPSISYKLPRPK